MWSSGIGTGFAISLKRDRFDGVFLRRGAIVGEREAFPFKCKGLAPVGFVCGKGFVELELPSLPLIHHLHRYALHRGPTTVSSCSQNVSPSFISKKLQFDRFSPKYRPSQIYSKPRSQLESTQSIKNVTWINRGLDFSRTLLRMGTDERTQGGSPACSFECNLI